MERIRNVRIADLLRILTVLDKKYISVDIIIDSKNRKVTIDPVESREGGLDKLTDDIILDLI